MINVFLGQKALIECLGKREGVSTVVKIAAGKDGFRCSYLEVGYLRYALTRFITAPLSGTTKPLNPHSSRRISVSIILFSALGMPLMPLYDDMMDAALPAIMPALNCGR